MDASAIYLFIFSFSVFSERSLRRIFQMLLSMQIGRQSLKKKTHTRTNKIEQLLRVNVIFNVMCRVIIFAEAAKRIKKLIFSTAIDLLGDNHTTNESHSLDFFFQSIRINRTDALRCLLRRSGLNRSHQSTCDCIHRGYYKFVGPF